MIQVYLPIAEMSVDAAAIVALGTLIGFVAARPVVADLSNHLVAITTGFSGTHMLAFGATDDRKGNIVMVVRGPQETHVVREKTRLAGIWMNRAVGQRDPNRGAQAPPDRPGVPGPARRGR